MEKDSHSYKSRKKIDFINDSEDFMKIHWNDFNKTYCCRILVAVMKRKKMRSPNKTVFNKSNKDSVGESPVE